MVAPDYTSPPQIPLAPSGASTDGTWDLSILTQAEADTVDDRGAYSEDARRLVRPDRGAAGKQQEATVACDARTHFPTGGVDLATQILGFGPIAARLPEGDIEIVLAESSFPVGMEDQVRAVRSNERV